MGNTEQLQTQLWPWAAAPGLCLRPAVRLHSHVPWLRGRVPSPLCGLGASAARAERLLPEQGRGWGNSASLLPAWRAPLRSPLLPGASREEGLEPGLVPSSSGCSSSPVLCSCGFQRALGSRGHCSLPSPLWGGGIEFKASSLGASQGRSS